MLVFLSTVEPEMFRVPDDIDALFKFPDKLRVEPEIV